MILAIVTDELRVPQARAFPLIRSWGMNHVELRGITGGRLPDGDVDEVERLVAESGMVVTSISPGVFKCRPYPDELREHLDRLRRTIDICPRFACKRVIVFSVQNIEGNERPTEIVVEALRQAGRIAADTGVQLAIENEPKYHATGSRDLANLIDEVGMANVGANWDPGNAYPYDDDIDRGPAILGSRVFNVHAKDTAMRGGERVFAVVGDGDIVWSAQIEGLRDIGYTGPVVVETHFEPGIENSLANVRALRERLEAVHRR